MRAAFGGDPAECPVEVEGLGSSVLGQAFVENWPVAAFFTVDDC